MRSAYLPDFVICCLGLETLGRMPTYSNMCPDTFSRIKEIVQSQPKYSKTQDSFHSSLGWASQFITKTSFLLVASRQACQKKVLGVSNEFYKDGFPSVKFPPSPGIRAISSFSELPTHSRSPFWWGGFTDFLYHCLQPTASWVISRRREVGREVGFYKCCLSQASSFTLYHGKRACRVDKPNVTASIVPISVKRKDWTE